MFDEVKVFVRSGDGGDGLITFRREKFVPRGGPSGGDGGHGGDVIFRVNPKLSTLIYFQKRVHFRAENGERGGSSDKTGATAPPLEIEVPPGTIIRDAETDTIIADLVRLGDSAIVVRGGRGGRGNARFKSSSHQAPRIAEKGEPGEERWLKLELKLIADVGLVGVPNAGKSTFLSVVSNARPKIADYPFTTLEPNLGVVTYDDQDLVFADIPGLIEGAHQGVGLGHSFLRHVQRTKVLVHLLDGASADPIADYNQINVELALYDENLITKPQIVVLNKADLLETEEQRATIEAALKKLDVTPLVISAATQQGVQKVVQQVFQEMANLPEEEAAAPQITVYELPEDEVPFTIEKDEFGNFHVTGRRIERAAAMTYWDYDEAVARFQNILEALGVSKALEQAGVSVGDTVFIGDYELEWSE